MTLIDCHKQAPSFARVPQDGADWPCDGCSHRFPAAFVVKIWDTGAPVAGRMYCLSCVSPDFMLSAKNCGTL